MKLDNKKLTEKLKAIIVSKFNEQMIETIDDMDDIVAFKMSINNWDLYCSITDVNTEFSLLEISLLLNKDSGIANAPNSLKELYANQLSRITMNFRGCKFQTRGSDCGIGICHFIFEDEQLNDEIFKFITGYLSVCFNQILDSTAEEMRKIV